LCYDNVLLPLQKENHVALKQAEQFALDSITEFVGILANTGQDKSQIETMLKERFTEFEQMTGMSLKLVDKADGGFDLKVNDTRRDFVRTRANTGNTMLSLRSKISGVAIDIKVIKDDERYSNGEVVSALAELQTIVAQMPVEMAVQGHADWSRTPGELPKSDDGTSDDADTDLEQEGQSNVGAPAEVASVEASLPEDLPVEAVDAASESHADVTATPVEQDAELPANA
jgi:hypothetical protein